MRVIATAGHVDHGKSTLVAALTGQDPDRLEEEKRRGVTIDLGFAWTALPGEGGHTIAFVDLPGHERFVPNMLAGAGPVSTALFVVAADEGWMPQSAEHLQILQLLDVRHGVVALTRTDLVDAETAAIAAELVAEELAGSGLADAPVVPVSAVTGQGLQALREALARMVTTAPRARDVDRPRLWVDRAFSVRGAGTVVTGTLAGGQVAIGDTLHSWPGRQTLRVRGLQALEQPVERAEPGWRVALNVVGADVADLPRGTMLGRDGQWIRTTEVDAWCTPSPGREVARRGAWKLHVGSAAVPVTVAPTAGVDLRAPGPVRITLDSPLALAAGDRFVLRAAGRGGTAGGGRVLDPLPGPRPRGTTQRREAVKTLTAVADAQGPAAVLHALVTARGQLPADRAMAMADAGDPDLAAAAGGTDPAEADVAPLRRLGGLLMAEGQWSVLSGLAVTAVVSTHQRRPALAVVDRSEARRLLATTDVGPEVVEAVIDAVVAEGRLEVVPGGLRVPGHQPRLTVAQQSARTALLQALDTAGVQAGALADMTGTHDVDEDLLAALVAADEIVLVDDDSRALSRRTVQSATAVLRALGPFTPAQARDALDTSRRYVLPLLEALDRRGVTRREGDVRQVV